MLGGRHDTAGDFDFDSRCSETSVGIKEKMVLEMPSEYWQCQGRKNMGTGRQPIPDTRCSGWKRFWSGHWCFPQWCRYGYRRGGPEWSWRCISWNLSKVQRLLVVQYLESSLVILKLILWRTGSQCRPARTGVMWQYRDFCAITRARMFWTIWRRARFDSDVPARREIQ